MRGPRYKQGDLVVLAGPAFVRSRHSNLEKPIPRGVTGYVLRVRPERLSMMHPVVHVALVWFDGYGPAIEVEEMNLDEPNALDLLVREV